jgi:hypothetical protein
MNRRESSYLKALNKLGNDLRVSQSYRKCEIRHDKLKFFSEQLAVQCMLTPIRECIQKVGEEVALAAYNYLQGIRQVKLQTCNLKKSAPSSSIRW